MDWFEKIKTLTTQKDNSPELKRGEVKHILLARAKELIPDFEFYNYRNNCYTFLRQRTINGYQVYESLHATFSLKEKIFDCSVASRINPALISSSSYDIGLINPHVSLITLKKGTGAIPIEESYYYHNGQVDSTTKIVVQFLNDFVEYGIPFLEQQLNRLNNNEIVKTGLKSIDDLREDREKLKDEIENELKTGGHEIGRIKHPAYIALKEKLQAIQNQSREDRQKIPMFAYDLLNLFWTDKKTAHNNDANKSGENS